MNRRCEERRNWCTHSKRAQDTVFVTELTRKQLSRAWSRTERSGRTSSSKGTERVKCEIFMETGALCSVLTSCYEQDAV